ncbi:hypothetical protein HELRODRAFT_172593 [Helobdella robusta]|uniref:Uncharacterized protein n=1 Tax=Helobdella robusta TaxID=6412 RepID=T1F5K7_HELRO|nr:hypothetical protein HELRODRAFT_172593 [Helobdella robusta]ESO04237.1 hypothetical protein HELRODRAFT_172593 [Helobdella robusta]
MASLDRTKTTYREAMHIVALALKAVGINVDELTLSTSSLYGSRKAIRQSIGKTIQNTFLPNTHLVAHFDEKLLPDFDGVNIDRLPIVVSGKNVEKLIAIPKIGGTGINIGTTIVQLLQNWKGVSNWLAEVWPQLVDYNNAKEIVTAVRVVNDCAERAVELASDFNTALTHDENQHQLMYKVIEHHRKLMKEP